MKMRYPQLLPYQNVRFSTFDVWRKIFITTWPTGKRVEQGDHELKSRFCSITCMYYYTENKGTYCISVPLKLAFTVNSNGRQ